LYIDGFNLGLETGTGVATYARNLSYACRDMGRPVEVVYGMNKDHNKKYGLLNQVNFFDPVRLESYWTQFTNVVSRVQPRPFGMRAYEVPITGDVITDDFMHRLPHFDRIWNSKDMFGRSEYQFAMFGRFSPVRGLSPSDIMHWTYPIPMYAPRMKNIYTIHDLVPLKLPYTTLDNKNFYFKLNKKIVDSADHIVTVSETSRNDIIKLLDCPPEKVTNTYQSVEMPAKFLNKSREEVVADIENSLGFRYKEYFLFFGSIEPKKNVSRLLEAYLGSGLSSPLVLAGKAAWMSEKELRLLEQDSVNQYSEQVGGRTFTRFRIRHLDYVPFPLLVSLIRGAKATVFPSLYEGFGLPILESMLLGTPVITSAGGATEEVAGDAALLVNPYDSGDIARAMREMDENAELRESLSAAGIKRAQAFSAVRYRDRLATLYERFSAR
jgi:glycosyltransferase involved in cell wall biosynthesis